MNIEKMEQLRDFAYAIIDFMTSKVSINDKFVFNHMKIGIQKAYERKNWKGLPMAIRDLTDMSCDLSSSDYSELNAILQKKFGKTIEDLKANTQKKIAAIIKRGEIVNADEYRLVQSRIDEIYADKNKAAELEVLNQLLIDIHSSGKKLDE